ncbi:MAG TPA: amidohydrolase family protein [Clostridia bacterium]|nr:amidohydrolase family protein [Clostridia bacterium]
MEERRRYLIDAKALVTLESRNPVLWEHSLLVENGRIVDMRPTGLFGSVNAERLGGFTAIALPGFVNAHTHSQQNLDRGTWDTLPLEVWMTDNILRPKTFAEDSLEVNVLLGCADMIKSGVVAVVDHLRAGMKWEEDLQRAVYAYQKSGMRGLLAVSLTDKPYYEAVPEELVFPSEIRKALKVKARQGTWNRQALMELARFCALSTNDRVSLGLGPSTPERCSNEILQIIGSLCKEFNLPIHFHLLESKCELITMQRRFGKPPVRKLEEFNLLKSRTSVAHAVWLSDEDMDILAENGVTVTLCPVSNLKLGSGVPRVAEMRNRDLSITLGTDGAATSDSQNIFRTITLTALLERSTCDDYGYWIRALDVLKMATGYKNRNQWLCGGAPLRVGGRADIIILNVGESYSPVNNPVNHLVYVEDGSTVDTVLIDGEVVMKNRKILTFNEEAVRRRASEIVEERLERLAEESSYPERKTSGQQGADPGLEPRRGRMRSDGTSKGKTILSEKLYEAYIEAMTELKESGGLYGNKDSWYQR